MRKLTVSAVVAGVMLFSAASHAQVYNTAQKLREGAFRLCFAPLLLVEGGSSDLGLYALGGFGVTNFMDLYFNTRIASNNRSNFGADLQWVLVRGTPALSLSTGAHVSDHLGIDGTLDCTFPVSSTVVLYGGLDMDIEFINSETTVPAWVFLGPRIQIRRNTTLFMEVDLGVTDYAPSIFGLGLSFYL
jgi:hypothetical protein